MRCLCSNVNNVSTITAHHRWNHQVFHGWKSWLQLVIMQQLSFLLFALGVRNSNQSILRTNTAPSINDKAPAFLYKPAPAPPNYLLA
jgi:hypothetical protein